MAAGRSKPKVEVNTDSRPIGDPRLKGKEPEGQGSDQAEIAAVTPVRECSCAASSANGKWQIETKKGERDFKCWYRCRNGGSKRRKAALMVCSIRRQFTQRWKW